MTFDQILPGAILAVILILVAVGIVRVAQRRRGANEEWTARTANGGVIAEGAAVRVVSQDGLTLIVEPEIAGRPAEG